MAYYMVIDAFCKFGPFNLSELALIYVYCHSDVNFILSLFLYLLFNVNFLSTSQNIWMIH